MRTTITVVAMISQSASPSRATRSGHQQDSSTGHQQRGQMAEQQNIRPTTLHFMREEAGLHKHEHHTHQANRAKLRRITPTRKHHRTPRVITPDGRAISHRRGADQGVGVVRPTAPRRRRAAPSARWSAPAAARCARRPGAAATMGRGAPRPGPTWDRGQPHASAMPARRTADRHEVDLGGEVERRATLLVSAQGASRAGPLMAIIDGVGAEEPIHDPSGHAHRPVPTDVADDGPRASRSPA